MVVFLVFSCVLLYLIFLFETWSGFLLSPAGTWFVLVAIGLAIKSLMTYRTFRASVDSTLEED